MPAICHPLLPESNFKTKIKPGLIRNSTCSFRNVKKHKLIRRKSEIHIEYVLPGTHDGLLGILTKVKYYLRIEV